MTPFEVETTLDSMVVLIDTREQDTDRLHKRMDAFEVPTEKRKLNVGDYSCKCTLPTGVELDFSSHVVIERKMDIDELCGCFCRERARFVREFERAYEEGCRIYLLIENGNWEKVYNGKYRSKLNSKALIASINAFRVRYGMQLDFCKEETTGRIIKDVLYRELKEYLQGCDLDDKRRD